MLNKHLSKWVQSCLGLCSLKQESEHAEQADTCLSKWVQELSNLAKNKRSTAASQ